MRHSIDRPSEIQTGWTLYKYNYCVWTGFCHSHCQCQLRGDSVPSRGSSLTGGLSWTLWWQIYHICYLLRMYPLRNAMRTPCSKDGGMVHRGGEDLSAGTMTRNSKKIMIQLSHQSAINMNMCLLFYILLKNHAWQNKKKIWWLFALITSFRLNKWCYQGQTSMHMSDVSYAKRHIINHIDVHQYNLSLKLVVIMGTANLVPSHSHQASANEMEIY